MLPAQGLRSWPQAETRNRVDLFGFTGHPDCRIDYFLTVRCDGNAFLGNAAAAAGPAAANGHAGPGALLAGGVGFGAANGHPGPGAILAGFGGGGNAAAAARVLWPPEIPEGLPNHLRKLTLAYENLPKWENAEICLGIFSECAFLERLTICFGNQEGIPEFRITGLAALPASCQKVMIQCVLGEDMVFGPPCVQPAVGWRVELFAEPYGCIVCSKV